MLGRSARQRATIADRVFEEGHDVGCHSNEHLNSWKVDPWTAVDDLNSGYETLRPWVRPNGIYRPPYGKMTLPTYWAIRKRRAHVGWWTIDSGDARKQLPSPKQVADRVLREGGGVVLMHDLDRSSERDNFVIETTALLLALATREGFNITKLSSLWR